MSVHTFDLVCRRGKDFVLLLAPILPHYPTSIRDCYIARVPQLVISLAADTRTLFRTSPSYKALTLRLHELQSYLQ